MTDAMNKQLMRLALGVRRLPKRAKYYTTEYNSEGNFIIRGGMGRVIAKLEKKRIALKGG